MTLESRPITVRNTVNIVRRVTKIPMFSALHYRNFRLLLISTFAQSVGFFMMTVAIGWQVLELTDSAFSLGMVWVARQTPHLIFGVLAGTVADKVDRRELLIWALILMAVCCLTLGILTTKDLIEMWHILFISFITGTIRTFAMTTRQAFAVDIVGREDAMNAIAMNAVAMRTMGVVGGVVAGFVGAWLGIDWCYYIMIIAYLVGVVVLLPMRGLAKETSTEQPSTWGGFVEGIKLIGQNRIVLGLVLMAVLCEIFGFSLLVVLPIFARDILKVGVVGLGVLTTMQSVGGLLGGLGLAALGNYEHKGWLILGIFLTFGIFLVLFSQSVWYIPSLILMAGLGAMMAAMDAMQHTMLQLNVTEEQRGRAMGIWMLSIGFGPVGFAAIGAIAGLIGTQLAVSINGSVLIAVFIIMLMFVAGLRKA